MQKFILILLALAYFYFNNSSAAIICPSISSIKSSHLSGWNFLNALTDEPADTEQIHLFQQTAEYFDQAEWSSDYINGNSHCYYASTAEVFLAKESLGPEKNNFWQEIGSDFWRCKSTNIADCQFRL